MFPSTDILANSLACRAFTEDRAGPRHPSFPGEPERRQSPTTPRPTNERRMTLAGVWGRIRRSRTPARAA